MRGLTNIEGIYFLGIGGIGMSALARYFLSQGFIIAGYDRTESPLTDSLADEGCCCDI
jgi:UDP-N-acetylmuramate--alanine ligase